MFIGGKQLLAVAANDTMRVVKVNQNSKVMSKNDEKNDELKDAMK